MTSSTVPYWRLSGFYFVYFTSLGVLVPYWSLYLKSLDFNATQIGQLIATLMLSKIFAPYIWGWVSDHTGKGMRVVRITSVFALASFALIFIRQDYWWLLGVMMLFSFFWNATLPQFEVTTMNHLGDETQNYSRIRVWGSLGFILAVIVLGEVLETVAVSVVPQVLLVVFISIAAASFLVYETVPERQAEPGGHILQVIKQPVVLALIVVCFLVQFSHGPYYTFYTIYLEDHGYQRGVIGWLWALGVGAEVLLFLFMHRLMPAYGARKLLLLALLLTAVRWQLIAHFIDIETVVFFAQLLHAASFGLFHAVSIYLFYELFKGKYQGRGQALYASVSFGAGGAAGSLLSGMSWETLGPDMTFSFASLAVFISYFIARRYIHMN